MRRDPVVNLSLTAAREADDPGCLRDGEAARLLSGLPWRRLVVLGDGRAPRRVERVDGYDRAPWYDRVADALRVVEPRLACLSLLGGREQSVAAVRSRQLPRALAFGGDLAVVQLAGHDVLHPAFDANALRTEVVRVVAPLREHGYDVVLVTPFDLTRSPGARLLGEKVLRTRQRAQSDACATLALRHGALYVDLAARHPAAREEMWSEDGLVQNGRGQAVMAAAVVRTLGDHLRATRPVSAP
ncbi:MULTISPECIES: GDSL-type esterase/lipase family protein [unclassified Streptomyces]|uniref:GDSL-type esterase/lipase family protein n=1 Tax=unclassified Streptomyces TaxID=2593676 RepID=UPI002E76CF51|nr:GDSL-type esterase/lipase family protein [Streptomyces sp. JV176]MEE1802529.1 SGNH/GDSL hydrolase family protein [Streptomyces sp. JV176]